MFRKDLLIFIAGIFVFLLIDRGVKVCAISLEISKLNPNLILGIGLPSPLPFYLNLFGLITALGTFLLLIYKKKVSLIKNNTTITLLLMGAIIGSGGGNLIDRCIYDGVVDYIPIANLSLFNFADVIILISFIILLYFFLVQNMSKNK